MRLFTASVLLVSAIGCASHLSAQEASNALDFTLDSIDGKPYALSQHKGEVVLLVNVASK